MKKRKELLIYGVALVVLAIIEGLNILLDFRAGAFDMVTTEDELVQRVTNIILYVIIGFSALSILIELYLGVKGIMESRNPSGGKFHISLARFIGILNLVLIAILGLALLNSENLRNDLKTISLCAVDIIFMFSYASAAKSVRNGEE